LPQIVGAFFPSHQNPKGTSSTVYKRGLVNRPTETEALIQDAAVERFAQAKFAERFSDLTEEQKDALTGNLQRFGCRIGRHTLQPPIPRDRDRLESAHAFLVGAVRWHQQAIQAQLACIPIAYKRLPFLVVQSANAICDDSSRPKHPVSIDSQR
jgi:hypothetical protein